MVKVTRIVWQRADIRRPESWLSTFVSLLMRIGTLLLMGTLIALVWQIFSNDGYAIDVFSVPQTLTEDGYTGEIIARKMQDMYLIVKQEGSSVKEDSVKTDGPDQAALQVAVMGFGVSLRSIAFQLRELVGRPNQKIHGEITRADSALALTLRMTGFEPKTWRQSLQQGESIAIERLLRQAGESILGNTDPYRLILYYERKHQYEAARQVVSQMLATRPQERHWALLGWGIIEENQHRPAEAELRFRESVRSKPDFALALSHLGIVLEQQRRLPEALEAYQQALQYAPNDPIFWNSYAFLLINLKRYEEADRAFARVADLTKGESGWMLNWIQAKLNRNERDGAIAIYQRAIAEAKDEGDKAFLESGLAELQGDTVKAYRAMLQSYAINPTSTTVIVSVASQLFAQKNYRRTIEVTQRYRPDPAGDNIWQQQAIYTYLAMSYNFENQHDSALVWAQRCIALDSTAAYPYTNLAETYEFMHRRDLFYYFFEKALRKGLNPVNIDTELPPYRQLKSEKRYVNLLKKYKKNL